MKALESRKKCYEMLSPRHNVLIAEPNQSSHNCSLEVRDGSPEALYPAKGLYCSIVVAIDCYCEERVIFHWDITMDYLLIPQTLASHPHALTGLTELLREWGECNG